jgi:hypothetical protein
MDGRKEGRMDGWVNMHGWTGINGDGWMHGSMDDL